jgi:thiol-disulfide isomerase/thioredoxin
VKILPDEFDRARRRLVGAGLLSLAGGALMTAPARAQDGKLTPPVRLRVEGKLPSFAGATGWLNSAPLSSEGLQGKVVLLQIWTYTCINWIRTLPYVRAWADKYSSHGLMVIGVHSPEFEFEKDAENVRRAAKAMNVSFPIAIDSDFAIWRALNNQAWPALYFVDSQGRIRHRHYGEGEYAQSERIIQYLLDEAGAGAVDRALVAMDGRGVEAPADWGNLRSPETYVGYERAENFASRGGALPDKRQVYAAPSQLRLNQWALSGDWTVTKDRAISNAAPSRIAYAFHARDVHLVMGPAARGGAARFRVLVDGQPPGAGRGVDTDEQGYGEVTQQRLYQLVRQQGSVRDRLLEIDFLRPGVEAFCFTFG